MALAYLPVGREKRRAGVTSVAGANDQVRGF